MNIEEIKTNLVDVLANYLEPKLRKLGFINDRIREQYLFHLYKSLVTEFSDDSRLAKMIYFAISSELDFRMPRVMAPVREFRVYEPQHIEDYVLDTLKLKYVSASDIASYIYCPVSYCIQKSFNAQPTKEGEIGIKLHNNNRLARYTDEAGNKAELNSNVVKNDFYDKFNHEFFTDIRHSNVYYVGHSKTKQEYFKSSKGRFVGQPDYIFINKEKNKYIVEEKFIDIKKDSNYFKDSHKAQLTSYIEGLDSLESAYGYLVYWYYDSSRDENKVKKCSVLKINRSDAGKAELREIYKKISIINKGTVLNFDSTTLSANKCANCVVRKYCGHKTGRPKTLSVPYGKNYYGLI